MSLNKRKSGARWFQHRILQDFQRRVITFNPQIVPHNTNRRNISKLFLWGYSYPDTKTAH